MDNVVEKGTYLPARGGEYMLVSVVPASLDHFPSVRLVLLDRRIGQKTDVVVNVEVEQGTRLATGLVDDEVVECVVLKLAVSSKSAVDAYDMHT